MRWLLIMATMLPLAALDNSKTIHNRTAQALANHPFTIQWYFAEGEIANYPKPFLTPSDTHTRAAAAAWQADVKSRWRDRQATRNISNVRTASPSWSIGSGLVSIVELDDTATVTMSAAHGLRVGDRLMITGATGDADLNRDHYLVVSVPSATTVTVRTQDVSNATYTQAGTKVEWVIDPAARNYCRVESAGHRLEVADRVSIAGVGGMSGVNGTHYVTAVSENEFLINTTCTGSFTGAATVTGPDYGSVKAAIVSFRSAVPASGSVRADMVDSTDACHLGGAGACRAAGLDRAAMLAFSSGNWNAQLETTANVKSGSTAKLSANARDMLAAWTGAESYCSPRYWIKGPVATQLILEYACEGQTSFDYGWKIVPGLRLSTAVATTVETVLTVDDASNLEPGARLWFLGTGNNVELMRVESVAGSTVTVTRNIEGTTPQAYALGKYFGVLQWMNAPDDSFKSLRPGFVLTFYPGWSGVKEEVRLENIGWSRQQGLYYAPMIKTGAGLGVRFSRSEMHHPTRTRWRKIFWDGTDPEHYCEGGSGTDPDNCASTGGGTRALRYRVDHNTDYLTYAGALMPNQRNPSISADVWLVGDVGGAGFDGGDMGDIGVARTGWALSHHGDGNWGSDDPSHWEGRKDFQSSNNMEEGWPLTKSQIVWSQTWSEAGYGFLFGTAVAGGGGNNAVTDFIPFMTREDEAGRGPYVAGFNAPAFGRMVSVHNRPSMASSPSNYTTSTAKFNDQPKLSCWTAGQSLVGSSTASQASQWPCFWIGTRQGYDGWNFETAHMNEYSYLPWLITGDEWHWQSMMARASMAAAWGHGSSFGRNIGKLWAWSYQTGHVRMETWGTLGMLHALAATPTENPYGQAQSPERQLLLTELWDAAMFAEGITQTANGWASILYAPSFTTDCTGWSAALGSVVSSDRYRYGRCTLGTTNPLGLYYPAYAGLAMSSYTHIDPATTTSIESMWMTSYNMTMWKHALDLGFVPFKHSLAAQGRWYANMVTNRNTNPYLLSYFRNPFRVGGAIPTTVTGWFNGHSTTGKATNAHASTSPGGYSYRSMVALAMADGIRDTTTPGCERTAARPGGCSARLGYEWFKQTAIEQDLALTSELKYYIHPRDTVANVRVEAGSREAAVYYDAPSAAACTYAIGMTAPAASLDAGEPGDGGTSRARKLLLAGLTPSTSYFLRLTCGGSARTSVQFATQSSGGAVTMPVSLKGSAGCGAACRVRLEHSDDGTAWTPMQLTACASGCTFQLPATAARAKHIRYTYYRDAGGTEVSSTGGMTVIVKP